MKVQRETVDMKCEEILQVYLQVFDVFPSLTSRCPWSQSTMLTTCFELENYIMLHAAATGIQEWLHF
jgi:hypothetical protein